MKKTFFDSTAAGIVRYFVRPNDDIVLNSLEKLNNSEYLYRLLREDGYERVIFYDVGQNNCKVFAYDKLSHLSFRNPDEFQSVNITDSESIRSFYDIVKRKTEKNAAGPAGLTGIVPNTAKPLPEEKEYGKREITHFSKSANLITEFKSYISNALQSKNIKTAVVIQMEIFEQIFLRESMQAAQTSAEIVDTIRTVEKENDSQQNIIVFTAASRDSFWNLFSNSHLHNLHPWIAGVMRERNETDRVHRGISALVERGCIVLADSIGEDELANLLLRKKVIERDPRFQNIPFSKIHTLAGMLKNHLLQKNKCFETIPYRKVQDFIRPLNALMEKDETITELTEICSRLRPRKILDLRAESSVYVERVTQKTIQASEVSVEERQENTAAAMARLDAMIGMDGEAGVKETVKKLLNRSITYGDEMGPGHYIFNGNPGTGKTEVARLMGDIFKAQGLLRSGHIVEVQGGDLVAEHVGGSASKTRKICERALDGVLFIDEAYVLVNTEPNGETYASQFAKDAYTELMALMENNRDRLCVICAGYADKMGAFVSANPGMKDRIRHKVVFSDYTEQELYAIFLSMAGKDGFTVAEDAAPLIAKEIRRRKDQDGDNFANGRTMRNLFEDCKTNIASRMTVLYNENRLVEREQQKYTITAADVPGGSSARDRCTFAEAMSPLTKMVGLTSVIQEVKSIANLIKYAADRDQKTLPGHYVFAGNPGTGKTEVARLFSKILYSLGVLSEGHLVEVSREDLVAEYEGQTSIKTKKKCQEALGGVLFVDEAYRLFEHPGSNGFGTEALETIMKFMEDNRSRMTVIFAGYVDRMEALQAVNDGFASRISAFIKFPDYSADELVQIMKLMAEKQKLFLEDDFIVESRKTFVNWIAAKSPQFGNARAVRNYLNDANKNRVNRLGAAEENGETIPEESYNHLIRADVPADTKSASNSPPAYRQLPRHVFETLPEPYGLDVTETRAKLNAATDPAVLFIKTDKGCGTAFLVSPDGYALTCHHVIAGATEITARLRVLGRPGGSDSSYRCEVINARKDYDIALIRLLGGTNFPYLKLADCRRKITKGEGILLSGYPFGDQTAEDLTTFYGAIASSELQKDRYGYTRFNIDCQAKCGNSGAPIIATDDGCVIGVLLGSMTNTSGQLVEEINHMRPIEFFWKVFLK